MQPLSNGKSFPQLKVPAVSGGVISLPDDLTGSYGVILFYRGSWCPYCNAQLASFGRAREVLQEAGIKVIALSVDDETTSAALVAKHQLPFPVGTVPMPRSSQPPRGRSQTTSHRTCSRPDSCLPRTAPC